MFWQQELFLLSVCQTDRQRALTSFSDVICEMSERVIGKVILLFFNTVLCLRNHKINRD